MTVSHQLRQSIRASDLTHYRIGTDTGINIRTIDRFVTDEKPMHTDTFDELCRYLGLELCRKKGQTAKKQPAKKHATATKRKRNN